MIYNSSRHNIDFNTLYDINDERDHPSKSDREYFVPSLYSYDRNIYGFRSENFHRYTDLVTLGCSQGFGVGLPVEYTWPSIVAKHLRVRSHANLSLPGCSIFTQVRIFANFINKYGPPKIVLATFPNSHRYEYVKRDGEIVDGNCDLKQAGPTDVSQHESYASWLNLQALNFLEAICFTNRIKLRWQFWTNPDTFWLDEKLILKNGEKKEILDKNKFKNYIDLVSSPVTGHDASNYKTWLFSLSKDWLYNHENKKIECQDIRALPTCCKDLEEETLDFFHFAYDRYRVPHQLQGVKITMEKFLEISPKTTDKNINEATHYGSHWQYHWAQSLIQSL